MYITWLIDSCGYCGWVGKREKSMNNGTKNIMEQRWWFLLLEGSPKACLISMISLGRKKSSYETKWIWVWERVTKQLKMWMNPNVKICQIGKHEAQIHGCKNLTIVLEFWTNYNSQNTVWGSTKKKTYMMCSLENLSTGSFFSLHQQ